MGVLLSAVGLLASKNMHCVILKLPFLPFEFPASLAHFGFYKYERTSSRFTSLWSKKRRKSKEGRIVDEETNGKLVYLHRLQPPFTSKHQKFAITPLKCEEL